MIDDFFFGGGGVVCLCIVSLLVHFPSVLLNSSLTAAACEGDVCSPALFVKINL